jgi:branched-chain amino acid transport system permease protein
MSQHISQGPVALLRRHQTPLILIMAIIALAGLSLLGNFSALSMTLVEMMIRIVVVVGMYIFIGNSGVVSFGHIGFMCIGAYGAAWASADPMFKQIMLSGLPEVLRDHQYSFAVSASFGVFLAAFAALIFGGAILRLAGISYGIATFAFLIMVNSVYSNWESVTGGLSSITGIPSVVGLWTAVGFASAAILVAYLFQVSRYGLMLKASREDDVAARAIGVKVVRMRFVSFVLSAAVVGAGGALYAHFLGILTVDPFYLQLCFLTIAMLVVGGISSLSGAVLGVVVVTVVIEGLRIGERGIGPVSLPVGSQELGLGLLMALVLVFRPLGLSNGKEAKITKNDQ